MNQGQLLAGQTMLILGGAGNMGLATARLAALEGAKVILVGRRKERLLAAVETIPEAAASFAVCDATDESDLRRVLTEVGPVDHLVTATSSGTPHVRPPAATLPLVDLGTAKAVYSRLWAAYNAVHLAPHHVRPGGSVTIVSGASSHRPTFGFGVYGALHGALEALGRAAAVELAPIRVNVVSPGSLGVKPMRQLTHHRGRFEDLGAAVVAVSSNPAITATLLDVDGGESLGTWSGESDEAQTRSDSSR
jgi:NAD(P)-dependent dehydrogenase (short-subunit alcohol dehydrogenase family)